MSGHWLFILSGILLLGLPGHTTAWAADVTRSAGQEKTITLDTDPHLIGWWKFDEDSGKSAADSSPAGHVGTLQGALSFDTHSAPGQLGKAIKLEGNDDCVQITGFKGITGAGPRTVTAWIKTTATSGNLVQWGTDDAGKMWTFGHIRGRIGVSPKGGYYYMKAYLNDNAWHHVAVVVQEASPPNLHDHVKLFKDGELAEVDDIGLLDLLPIETGDKLDVSIGRHYKGFLDDLRLYDRALSENEIKALFKRESQRPLAKP